MNKVITKNKGKVPVITAGDFNARIQKATNNEEKRRIGPWTFEPETARIHGRTEGILENRNLLVQTCNTHDLIVCNTWFKKAKKKNSDLQRSRHNNRR